MKPIRFILTAALLMLALLPFQGCLKDSCTQTLTYIRYTPVVMNPAEYRLVNYQAEAARELIKPGKIYLIGDYLLINEQLEGIHVIDNSNPASPQNVSFIPIPGNKDIAMKDGYLMADSYTDLVVLAFNGPQSVQFVRRVENMFTSFGTDWQTGFPIVGYTEEVVTEETSCSQGGGIINLDNGGWMQPMDIALGGNLAEAGASQSSSVGSPGSMTRFITYGNYLYALDTWVMRVLDISNPAAATTPTEIQHGYQGETLFATAQNLFMGTTTGMLIYDLSNPASPVYMSAYAHLNACDPVVVQGNRAYVTLRNGTECENFTNQLEVIDITDLYNPSVLAVYSMHNPHGLSVNGQNLWLCDGSAGLKVFDISDDLAIGDRLLDHLEGFGAYDVIKIPGRDIVLVIGEDGLYQFDTSNPASLQEISRIAVVQ